MDDTPPPLPASSLSSDQPLKRKSRIRQTLIVVALLYVGFCVVQFGLQMPKMMREGFPSETPGYKELEAAQRAIGSNRGGVAHGNNSEAVTLAANVSKEMRSLRELLFEKGKGDKLLMTGGDFIVYCQLNEATCAFIVHVPEMRRFTDDAKEAMMQFAYLAACQNLDSLANTRPRRLAVATRGLLYYDRIWVGDYQPKSEEPLAHAKPVALKMAAVNSPELLPFFLP